MPKAVTTYYCNICGQGYKKEQLASNCENNHLIPIGVTKPTYAKHDKAIYPDSVLVTLQPNNSNAPKSKDNITIRYYRKG